MKVTLECYGVLEQLCGPERPMELAGESTSVAAVLGELAQQVPGVAPHLKRTACAVGDELVGRERRLHDGETVALLPPVSGGCP